MVIGRSSDFRAFGIPTSRRFPALLLIFSLERQCLLTAVVPDLPLRGSSGFSPDSLFIQRDKIAPDTR